MSHPEPVYDPACGFAHGSITYMDDERAATICALCGRIVEWFEEPDDCDDDETE